MKNLIVNADDLAWTHGVNRGILDAHLTGIVTSTSLLANGIAFDDALAAAKSAPNLGIGVHLNLSDGPSTAPPEAVTSILNDDGQFLGGPETLLLKIATGSLNLHEVEDEWSAQIEKILAAGIQPTHIDGHKHVHMLPGLFEIALRLAKRNNIGAIRVSHEASSLRAALATDDELFDATVFKQGVQARGLKLLARDAREQAHHVGIATADYFCGIAQTGEMTKEGVVQLLNNLPEGTTELMCHPGYLDEDLQKSPTRLQESRATELAILTDPEVRNLVASQGIRLIDYGLASSQL